MTRINESAVKHAGGGVNGNFPAEFFRFLLALGV